MSTSRRSRWAAIAALGLSSFGAQASFTITLDLTAVSAPYQSYFSTAKSFWENVITGYQTGISLTGLSIAASTPYIDGVGFTLGQAGPTFYSPQPGFNMATQGVMQFDSADVDNMVANGSFADVIKHEMAHVLGFGTMWGLNNVYADGSGQFTGAAALAEYRIEYGQPLATDVPVELGGGGGTANGHWDEVNGGAGLTGVTDGLGRDMRNELMTGWLDGPTYVSRTTVASFQDIGYVVNLSAVPEPGVIALWLQGAPLVAGWASRRRVHA